MGFYIHVSLTGPLLKGFLPETQPFSPEILVCNPIQNKQLMNLVKSIDLVVRLPRGAVSLNTHPSENH